MVLIGFVTSRNVTLVQLNFIYNVCQIFKDFLKSFQSDEPQIHRLYDVMGNLIVTEICNKEKDTKPVHVTDLPDVDLSRSNQLQDSEISIGEDSINSLKKCSVRTKEISSRNVISFWCHRFLSSKEIAIQKQASCKFRIFKSSENSFDQTIRHWTDCKETVCIKWQYSEVTDEWKVLSMDQSIHSLSYQRVDHFPDHI